ncbi:MAG: hypothetical protein IPM85_06655 [Chitinophagaceae bacterium]|nr:hypothetical protein [Chitinophagaceae bacterium]
MVLFSSSQMKYDELHTIFKKNAITYAEYANLITLRDIYTETILLKRKAHFDIDEDLKKRIATLLEQIEYYSDASHSTSFWYCHYYYMSKATLLYINNSIDESLTLLKLVLTKWHKDIKFLRTGGEFYVELLYMINYTGVLQGDYDYVAEAFHHPCNNLISEAVQRANFEVIKFLALNKIYNKTARYNDVENLIQPMKTAYQQWEPILNNDLNYTTNLSIAIGCFVLEQFNDAMYFAKRAFTYFKTGTREELSAIAQLLLLLIAYNMNSSRLFDAQYRNTYSYFYKRKKKHPFEAALVQCLHRTFYLGDSSAKIREYQKALNVFEQNKDDVVQKMTFRIFNYPGWLKSRIQRTSYRQYVENMVKSGSNLVVI